MAKKCDRLVVTASSKLGHVFSYQRPINRNDLKREGRSLLIGGMPGEKSIMLDGRGISILKRILKDSGEYGRRVNRKHARVLCTSEV